MNQFDDNFDAEIRKLQEYRPTLTGVRLDQIKQRVQTRRRSMAVPAWRALLRARAAVITAIAAGALMSSGGVALAVSGAAVNGTASSAQYAQPGTGPTAGVKGVGVTRAEATEQAPASSSGQLPFTGFVAVTLIVIGVGLAGSGLVIRFVVMRPRGEPRH